MTKGYSKRIFVGLTADRPVAGSLADPSLPTFYWSTDDEVLSVWDGSAWEDISGGGGGPVAADDVTVDSTTLVGTGTDAQAVFEEIDNAIADHLADSSAAHAASAISASSATLVGTATDVQGVFEELDNAIVATETVANAAVPKSLYDANTVLAADSDNTPAALTMAASTILARLASGNIKAATPAELRTLLATPDVRVKTGSTYYYQASGQNTTGAAGTGFMDLTPIWLPAGCTVDRLAIEVTAFITNGVCRLGIYSDSGFGYPGALLIDGGTVSTAGSNGFKEATISQAITVSDWYWLAAVNQTAAATLRRIGFNQISTMMQPTSFTGLPSNSNVGGYVVTGVTGALPNPVGTLAIQNVATRVTVRLT